ncbi:hypothetical protein OB236_12045 [Paenibacillus sp. WQ 127069]|uniref:ABC transmembrane type-1 domain-containing protein n=1 Tax=Paenibacillus baimaensis TaxID=2982185 RepID=A0ABT2UFP3_9BACL|nr:hypothetical protein [Paenibacillus sp. WQ 127069]MCU6792851.1 hypothetical protein [Paenibacillus sp. WQ 127069]
MIDGCNELGILVRIVLPLSLPSIATLSLFYAVDRWNGFQDALILQIKISIRAIKAVPNHHCEPTASYPAR